MAVDNPTSHNEVCTDEQALRTLEACIFLTTPETLEKHGQTALGMPMTADNEAMAAEAYAWCFGRLCNSMIFASGLLLPFYIVSELEPIASVRALRMLGWLVCFLDAGCLYASVMLRIKTALLTRRGHTVQLMKDMADIRQGLAGREKIILSVAPIYLMTTALALFSIELLGLLWYTCPDGSECILQNPPLDFAEYVMLQVSSVVLAAYAGRTNRFTIELGAPREDDFTEPPCVEEKV